MDIEILTLLLTKWLENGGVRISSYRVFDPSCSVAITVIRYCYSPILIHFSLLYGKPIRSINGMRRRHDIIEFNVENTKMSHPTSFLSVFSRPGVRVLQCRILPSDGWIPVFSFASIHINLLTRSHQPRALCYKSHLRIASKYRYQAPFSPTWPICLTIFPLRHPIYPSHSKHHVTLSTLRTPRICHLDFLITNTRHKWGACHIGKAHHAHRKGNVFPLPRCCTSYLLYSTTRVLGIIQVRHIYYIYERED